MCPGHYNKCSVVDSHTTAISKLFNYINRAQLKPCYHLPKDTK